MPVCKYPRTFHVAWSETLASDDKYIGSMAAFEGKRVIVTEKMDGENTTLMSDRTFARSTDSVHHYSRDWVKSFWATICKDIPNDWRICGENLWAQHAIAYNGLKSFFMGFSVWDDRNISLSWDATLEWFDLLGVTPVTVIYDGLYDVAAIMDAFDTYKKTVGRDVEGYVIRVADEIAYADFRTHMCKYVRKNHVQLDTAHWLYGGRAVIPNKLCTESA